MNFYADFNELSQSCANQSLCCFNMVYTKESLLKTFADFMNEYDLETKTAASYYKNYPDSEYDFDPEDDDPDLVWQNAVSGSGAFTPDEFSRLAEYIEGTLHTYFDCVESYANLAGISKQDADKKLSSISDSISEIKKKTSEYLATIVGGAGDRNIYGYRNRQDARISDILKKCESGSPRYQHERDVQSNYVRFADKPFSYVKPTEYKVPAVIQQ